MSTLSGPSGPSGFAGPAGPAGSAGSAGPAGPARSADAAPGALAAVRAAFLAFYDDVYLPDHAAPLNRWVHFLSNLSAVACCIGGVVVSDASLFALGVWCQLGPPYLGHILFEKTHRSIDQSPVFAAVGSWFTTFQILRGRQCVTHGPSCRRGGA